MGFGLLSGLGLIDGGMNAFLVVERGGAPLGEDTVIQDVSFVHHGYGAVEVLTEGDASPSEAIVLALELILPILELEGQVFGEDAGMVIAEDRCQLFGAVEQWPMGVGWVLGRDGEAPVVDLEKRGKEGVGGLDVGEPLNPDIS